MDRKEKGLRCSCLLEPRLVLWFGQIDRHNDISASVPTLRFRIVLPFPSTLSTRTNIDENSNSIRDIAAPTTTKYHMKIKTAVMMTSLTKSGSRYSRYCCQKAEEYLTGFLQQVLGLDTAK